MIRTPLLPFTTRFRKSSSRTEPRCDLDRTYGPPRCKRYLRDDLPVCVNVYGLMGSLPWPRWRSARSGPHKFDGVVRHSDYQGYGAQVDFQAILFLTTCSQVGRSAHGMRRGRSDLKLP